MAFLISAVCLCSLISPFFWMQEGFDDEKTARLFDEAESFSSDLEKNLTLIKEGADPNGKDDRGYAIVIIAAYNGNDEMVEALIKSNADVDAQGPDDTTALMMASHKRRFTVVPTLLDAGANTELTDKDGWTALMWASARGGSTVLKALLDAGANVNVKAEDKWTPLLLAIRNGHSRLVERLLEAGSELDSDTPDGVPAAILAVLGGNSEIVRAVIDKTGEPNVVDDKGWTPLMVAASRGDVENVMDLLRAGADATLKDAEGETALDKAVAVEHEETIAVLGGDFEKRQPDGGVTLEIPCKPLDGGVTANVKIDEGDLVFSTFYRKPLANYLGGFVKGAKSISAGMSFCIDTDLDENTGKIKEWGVSEEEVGTDVEVSLSEMRTTMKDEMTGENVSRQYMDASIDGFGENRSNEKIEEFYPRSERDVNALRVRVPLDVIELQKGQKVRLVVQAGFCDPVEKTITLE